MASAWNKGIVAALGLLALACSQGADFTPGACGLAGYDWLPADRVGQVLSYEELEGFRMSAATIDAMLSLAGAEVLTPVPFGARAFRLRYTTQDKGQAVEATGLVALPWIEGQTVEARPEVLFTHGTTGFANECAPSREAGEGDVFALLLLAAEGYAAAAPDYIGLDATGPADEPNPHPHAYLGMEQTAIASFDCLRAMRELLASDLAEIAGADGRVVLWGGSQGGHAVFACQLYAQHYAPEIALEAAVALVPPTDLQALSVYALSSPNPATAALTAVLTSLHTWYEGSEDLGEVLTEEVAGRIETALFVGCDADQVLEGLDEVGQVYRPGFIEAVSAGRWDDVEPWACYLERNSVLGSGIEPEHFLPTLFVVSELDDLVYAPAQRDDFERLCAVGYSLDYLECKGAQHAEGAVFSLPEQIAWVAERLAGTPIPSSELCTLEAARTCSADPDGQ
ncbi:MAG: alpha/beta fold hydrolase [Deltaproteobacteria bacterium]|nr:alpha/beta fold hydrolase [Deltaproteobacteria bacterium]